jgi:hypothetical protein
MLVQIANTDMDVKYVLDVLYVFVAFKYKPCNCCHDIQGAKDINPVKDKVLSTCNG